MILLKIEAKYKDRIAYLAKNEKGLWILETVDRYIFATVSDTYKFSIERTRNLLDMLGIPMVCTYVSTRQEALSIIFSEYTVITWFTPVARDYRTQINLNSNDKCASNS